MICEEMAVTKPPGDSSAQPEGPSDLAKLRAEHALLIENLKAKTEELNKATMAVQQNVIAPLVRPEPGRNVMAEAAFVAQRKVLLDALTKARWSLAEAASALRLHGTPAVIKYIHSLELEQEYEAAKARGEVRPGRPKNDS